MRDNVTLLPSHAKIDLVAESAPMAQQLMAHYNDLRELSARLEELERQYGMSSEEFNTRWLNGQLGDDTDFFEWHAYYDMRERTRTRIKQIVEELYGLLTD